jgi:molecular chaperone DnaK
MPLVERAIRDFFGTDPRHDLLGDEVVAIGAAVQCYALSAAMSSGEGRTAARGEQKQRASVRSRPGMLEMDADPDVLLLDVLPRTLGLEGADDTFNVVLHRNTKLPAHVRHLLTLNDPGEGPHRIRVIQGEDPRASQNTLLGELHLRNVVTDRNGRAQIEIQFRVDASGMLQLRATDLNSEDGAVITLESRLPGETTSEKA